MKGVLLYIAFLISLYLFVTIIMGLIESIRLSIRYINSDKHIRDFLYRNYVVPPFARRLELLIDLAKASYMWTLVIIVLFVIYSIVTKTVTVLSAGAYTITPWLYDQYQAGNAPLYIAGIVGAILMSFYKKHIVFASIGGALFVTAFAHWIGPIIFPK